jgi:PilZ domain
MGVLVEFKDRQKQRRSERTVPFISGEEMVLISTGSGHSMIGKMLDLSQDGTLAYVGEEWETLDTLDTLETRCLLTLYHQGQIFQIESKVARRSSRLIGFEFIDPSPIVVERLRAKINQMPDWLRVKGQRPE